jgi:hypothetical protein
MLSAFPLVSPLLEKVHLFGVTRPCTNPAAEATDAARLLSSWYRAYLREPLLVLAGAVDRNGVESRLGSYLQDRAQIAVKGSEGKQDELIQLVAMLWPACLAVSSFPLAIADLLRSREIEASSSLLSSSSIHSFFPKSFLDLVLNIFDL